MSFKDKNQSLLVQLGLSYPAGYFEELEKSFNEKDFQFWSFEAKKNEYGKGVIALENIPKGSVIAQFHGEVKPFHQYPYTEKPYLLPLGNDLWLNPVGPTRYINHSCEPNCELRNKVDIVSIRDIEKGEELNFRYDVHPVTADNNIGAIVEECRWDHGFTFICLCGSEHCVEVVDRNLPAKRKKIVRKPAKVS